MNRILAGIVLAWLSFGPAFAANVNIDGLPAASGVNSTDLLECEQSGTNNKCTAAQLQTFVNTSAVDPRTTTTEAIATSDQNKLVTFNNASAVAASIAQATSGTFFNGWAVSLKNLGAGTVTLTPTTSTIDGNATLTLATGQGVDLYSDGTNYFTQPGRVPAGLFTTTGALKGNGSGVVSQAACADLSNGATGCSTATGTSGATIPLLNGNNTESGNNTHTGSETFGEVIGGGRTVSITTDTLAMTDCGTTVYYSNAGAVTVTIPATLTAFCTIAIMQTGAGKVSVNGTAVSAATLHTAVASGAAVGTRAQYSVINVVLYQTGVANLVGDGA